MSDVLVAYFSASGTTAQKAKALSQAAKADLFEIKPEVPYSEADLNWRNPISRCNREMLKRERPVLDSSVLDSSAYSTLFLGFPIWYYGAPLIIKSFLDKFDFSGKKIVLFATSGGSSFGKTVEKLKKDFPGLDFTEGEVLNGVYTAAQLEEFVKRYI